MHLLYYCEYTMRPGIVTASTASLISVVPGHSPRCSGRRHRGPHGRHRDARNKPAGRSSHIAWLRAHRQPGGHEQGPRLRDQKANEPLLQTMSERSVWYRRICGAFLTIIRFYTAGRSGRTLDQLSRISEPLPGRRPPFWRHREAVELPVFECHRCGRCCSSVRYISVCHADVKRWAMQKRADILGSLSWTPEDAAARDAQGCHRGCKGGGQVAPGRV